MPRLRFFAPAIVAVLIGAILRSVHTTDDAWPALMAMVVVTYIGVASLAPTNQRQPRGQRA
jgi:hypothetical protein